MKEIILASGSPRRTEILTLAHIEHKVVVSDCEEIIDYTKSPREIVESLAYQKAYSVFKNNQDAIVIGADTVVVLDEILGKPKDKEDAIRMLKKLSNKTHQVITGVSIISKENIYTFSEITNVTFGKMEEKEIIEYLESENVYDKAGAYAIQGMASKYISKIDGDYYNVVGLPIHKVTNVLKTLTNKKVIKNEVIVIGGSNLDYVGSLSKDFNLYQSNVGKVSLYFGGVARNISENIARNGIEHSFITCIGNDSFGGLMKVELESLGIDLYIPKNIEKTGSFLSLNEDNNLYIGICDTNYIDKLTIDYVESLNLINDKTRYIILDANIPEDVINHIFNKYDDKYIIVDGISAKKVVKFKPYLDKISLLKVNIYEAMVLTNESVPELIMKKLINLGVQTVIITRGTDPTIYNIDNELCLEPTIKVANVKNTTGAGDAMLSGVIVGLIKNLSMQEAIRLGHKLAAANVQVETPTVKN